MKLKKQHGGPAQKDRHTPRRDLSERLWAVKRGTPSDVLKATGSNTRSSASVPIHIRVPKADLDAARLIAKRKGLGYQTYLKMLMHEGVQRDTSARNATQKYRLIPPLHRVTKAKPASVGNSDPCPLFSWSLPGFFLPQPPPPVPQAGIEISSGKNAGPAALRLQTYGAKEYGQWRKNAAISRLPCKTCRIITRSLSMR
jgi:hypothetical protein